MTDFGTVPPEITSGKIHAGPGPGSMLSASQAWEEVAAELRTAATSYRSCVIALIEGPWQGGSSAAMVSAALPFAAWLDASAAQAERTAGQADAAAAAFDTVFASTVPPTFVAANRAALATLIMTNTLGQNAPAIAATEAAYDEMWAQDATAMYVYAAASADARIVEPFGPPPEVTKRPVAQTFPQQPAPVDVPPSPTSPEPSTSALSLSSLNALTYPARFATYPVNFVSKALGFSKSAAALPSAVGSEAATAGLRSAGQVAGAVGFTTPTPVTTPAITAGMAQSHRFGPLSVPNGWSTPAPHAVSPGPGSYSGGTETTATGATPSTPVLPVGNLGSRTLANPTPRYDLRPRVIPRSPAAG